jgi:hypothetical protein
VGGPGDRAARSLGREETGLEHRQGNMSDDERTPDEAEPEERAEDDEDDVEAHSLPQPPPRPMNSL